MFRRLRPLGLMVMGGFCALAAQAQTPPPSNAKASANATSAEERAQQQADKVFTWIRLHAEKPQAKRAAPTVEAPAASTTNASAPAKALAKPANKAASPAAPATALAANAAAPTAAPQPASPPAAALGAQTAAQEAAASAAGASTLVAAASLTSPAAPRPTPPEPPAAAVAEPEPAPLKLLHKVDPEVPRQLQRDFRGGSVVLRFTVMADGSVQQAEAINASHKRLASAAVAALSQWRFAPIEAPRVASVEIGFSVE